MPVVVHGLEARQGDTAFAFLVLRLAAPIDRAGLVELVCNVAPLVGDAERLIADLPPDCEAAMRLVGIPWSPPESGAALEAQRSAIESAGPHGIEEAWFFQTGTRLPPVDGDDADDDDADDDDDDDRQDSSEIGAHTKTEVNPTTDDGWGDVDLGSDAAMTLPMQRSKIEAAEAESADSADGTDRNDSDDDDEGEGETWSHGPPPQTAEVRFPVDGYPAILETFDWEDFGIAFKLAGPWIPGDSTVLVGFHAMWLAPYGGRFRNAAVTIDRDHHAAHLWVDRFAVPGSPQEQVHHLLWIASKLDEVTPIVHACFRGATMAQKYGGIIGETAQPFVLGGNPLLAAHDAGGEQAVDAWIAAQTQWSNDEIAQMLRELAVELVTRSELRPREEVADNDGAEDEGPDHEGADDDGTDDEGTDKGDTDDNRTDDEGAADAPAGRAGEALFDDDDAGDDDARDDNDDEVAADADDDDADDDDADDDDDNDNDNDNDEEAAAAIDDIDRRREVTTYAGELLAARARAGRLDPRVAATLRPLLDVRQKYEHRRISVVSILGALRDRDSVPAMIRILESTRIASALDAVGKEELLTATAAALEAIADPAAIPALSKLVAAPGRYNDEPRAAAASALAACVAAGPARPSLDGALFDAMARAIGHAEDDEYLAEMHLAYAALARTLPPTGRAAACQRLLELDVELDPAGVAMLARRVALAMCGGDAGPDPDTAAALRTRVHAALSDPGFDHDAAIRNLRVVLRIVTRLPGLADAADLVWLTRLAEADVRARAHELLAAAGQPLPPAAAFDRRTARGVSDGELVRWIGEAHVVGRAALVAEAGRRKLAAARPAIIRAAHHVIDQARPAGQDLLDPEARLLETAVSALLDGPLDDDTIALFDRMLRHANHHVKWELLQSPPRDKRLIGGMLHVLGEAWGWQETAARQWLARFTATSENQPARPRVRGPHEHGHGLRDFDDDDDNGNGNGNGGDDDDESAADDDADGDGGDDDGRVN